ncbi:MAG TPA: DUF1330 domain-containing protein [Saprospiraceae bacterium]|nr:DUF1330 domain-containing protein [Saprospiraceae bacterium]HMP26088.1 DUF1330 domain-containing protein [Saprospiraceae bacterium]
MGKVILIIIATINPAEKEALDIYLKGMNTLYAEVGAKPVARYGVSKVLMGEKQPNLVSIMEFPDEAALDQVFKSEAYKALLPHRAKAFTNLEAFVGEN